MSQVAKSASAFVRAFLAILVLELEDMVVRLVRPPKFAGIHGYRWTVRLGISVDVRRPADEIGGCILESATPGSMLPAIRASTSLQFAVGV
jgi:hypothetical protein